MVSPAYKPWTRERILTENAPDAVGPYSQAITAGKFIFVSGQIGLVPGKKELAGPGIGEQTRQAMENIEAILDAVGSSMERIVKTTVFLKDLGDFAEANRIYASFFTVDPPARATIQAGGLPMGALIEIDAVALMD